MRERWIVEHVRALELGGVDDIDNMGPAHEACGREKTRDDHARTARAKRQKLRHLGAAKSTRPVPGSRADALKRKVDGTVVPRGGPARPSADAELIIMEGVTIPSKPTASSVDATFTPTVRHCPQPKNSASVNEAGTKEPTVDRDGVSPEKNDGTNATVAAKAELRPAVPAHLDFLFDNPLLLPGESEEQYDALLRSIVQQVKPVDVIEALWVKDIVDFIWEAKRLRLWRRQVLIYAQLKAAKN
ncbi:HNH endonuclease [Methylobacterium sp. J-026]|nr:HNH endonuclease [Methylobacterium sp. J-026]